MRIRTAILVGVLVGTLATLTVLIVHDTFTLINRRIDNIENYLSAHPIPQLQLQEIPQPQSQKESHKGELSKPEQWKI
jgi:hypothetical protein